MSGGSSSNSLEEFTLDPERSLSYVPVDTKSQLPRIHSYRNSYTPYSNLPPSQCFPRKRYIIMPPTNTQRTAVRYLRTLSSRDLGEGKIITVSPKRQVWANASSISSNSSRTQYVLKINRPKAEEYTSSPPRKITLCEALNNIDSSIPLHIPTVPPSMSIGAEYTEEEIDEQEVCPDNVETPQFPCFPTVIRPKAEQTQYNCMELDCFWRGSSLAALRRHNNSVHPSKQVQMMLASKKMTSTGEKPPAKPKGVRCSECDVLAYSRPLLLKHMTDNHGFEAPLINRTFDSREELQSWLEELRSTHAVEFVVSSGSKKWGYGLQVHYLTCSRSGDQKERPNKKFARPPRPSIKCGKNCMAYLKIKQNPVTSVLQIEGCLYHSGHLIDGHMIKLTPAEQRKILVIKEQFEKNLIHWDAENMSAVREILGGAGRFRLISDCSLADLIHTWIKEIRVKAEVIEEEPSFYDSIAAPHNKFEDFDMFSSGLLLDNFGDEYSESSLLSDTQ